MKLLDNIKEIDANQWNSLINISNNSSFFQSKACYDFYASLSFMEPFVYAVKEKNILKGVIVGYIQKENNAIKHYFTRRAIIPGGILLSDDISKQALESLLTHCKNALLKKAIYIECRNYTDFSKYKSVFIQSGFNYLPHLNFHVDTSSIEIANKNLGKSRKRDIKTSIRDGAELIYHPTFEEVRCWYEILFDLYKTRIKTPLFSFEFFSKLFHSGIGIFLLVKYKDEIIGGTLCVGLSAKVLYEWFACGLDGKYKNIYPSTLATWSGIEYAATHNYLVFDMMGAGKPDEVYGVREFKAKFGGELVEHGRFLCVLHPLLYQIGKIGVKILKKIR
ncbi:MAG TPA: peptidoglycan bridge formation glycyltransferase FemA/FemB family protein [Bacteroidales bacterium]|mgnify:FL=1|nr:peptidoglycan bridge formation glycyltransferase FemA/FemB family protein [Bacteroidales bacterium]